MKDESWTIGKWALVLFLAGLALAAVRATADAGEPEVELTCSIDTREGRAEVTCLAVSVTHRCQVREITAETGPTLPGSGVRTKLTLFCPSRLSTVPKEQAELIGAPQGCQWTVPVQGVDRLLHACVGAPGSRQRKLRQFWIPTPDGWWSSQPQRITPA